MRKIAFLSALEYVPWGGSEYCWAAAAERFAKSGAEVRVSVKGWPYPVRQVEHLKSVGCRIFSRPDPPRFYERAARKLLRSEEFTLRHMRALGDGTDLVVISQGGNTDCLVWAEAARALGYKYALIAEGAYDILWPDDSGVRRLAEAYESAAAAYFVSQAILEFTRHEFATPLSRGRIVRNPFNVRYDASPAWPAAHSPELSLACVARIDVGTKRHDLLLKVLALPHWKSRDVRLSIVGDGPNEYSMRQMAATLRLANVEFLNSRDNIEAVWASHHALALVSRTEGMPLVVVEAMLCGRPCIVTDVGGNCELVRDGVNGFVAKAPTVEFVDEAMNRAWENRHRLREMGQAAARDVRAWVSRDPTADFVRELEGLMDGALQTAI